MNRITFALAQFTRFTHVTNIARTAALVVLMAATHGAQAVEVQSFSFGCSNAGSMSSGNGGGSGKASFDLKTNVKRSTEAATSCDAGAPRDAASGQASGKAVAGYDLKAGKGARSAAPTGGDTSAPAEGHKYPGTVTIVK